jgi:psp operon transcriptional activator
VRAAGEAHERALVEHHLGRNRWNQRQTAKALGLTYDQLRHCLRKHGLSERGSLGLDHFGQARDIVHRVSRC